MPPKKEVKGVKSLYKIGTQVKDVIPQTQKNLPRDGKALKAPEQPTKQAQPEYQPLPDPELWPGDEVVSQMNLSANDNLITRPHLETGNLVVFWRRPRHFLRKKYTIESENEPPFIEMRDFNHFGEDSYSTRIETEEKREYMQTQIDQELTICESYERQETQEEVELRRQQFVERQAQNKNKKGAKKGPEEVFDENPKMVADVKLSDLICTNDMPEDCRWITSQLQMIKDQELKDCFTQKPLSSKIYPQKDGAPIYNPSGKYIVKLYFMGQERKITISDHMPTSFRGQVLLGQSEQRTQLWPMIFQKAILQLWEHQLQRGSLVGDGFVMYALTGLMSESINIQSDSWKLIDSMLSFDHYANKDVVVSAYTLKSKGISNTNNRSRRDYQLELLRNPEKELDIYDKGVRRVQKAKSRHEEVDEMEETQRLQQEQQMDQEDLERQANVLFKFADFQRSRSQPREPFDPSETNLNTCFSYCLLEQFQNENGFNMVYAQKRSEKELRLRQELHDLAKTSMNKMSKDEKLELRRRKKEIKERLADDDKKRISLITQQPIKHRFVRLKSSIKGKDQAVVYSPLGADEIYIAKKCIKNKLNKPPNFDLPEIRNDDKSVVSQTLKGDDSFSIKPLDDFSSINNAQEPEIRGEGGFWIHEKEFMGIFEHVQIAYDPKRFNLQVIQIPLNADNDIATYDPHEIVIVQKNQELDEKNEVQFLFGFQAKYAQNIDFQTQVKPSAILQRFDLETYESIYDYKVLNQCLSCMLLMTDNKNHIFRLNVYSPLNFTIWLASNNNIKTISVFDYLIDYEAYQKQSVTIDYPSAEANKYFLFFRFKIEAQSAKDQCSFVYRIKSTVDNLILKHLKLKLVEVPPPGNSLMLTTIEGVHKNLFESDYIILGTQRFSLKSNTTYYFMLEGVLPYNCQEGSFEMDFLYNDELSITQLESTEPLKYMDKYTPTKYGIIFRERVYSLECQATFYVRLARAIAQQQQQPAQIKGKQGKGPEVADVVEQEMLGERIFKLELFRGDELIQYAYGINKAVLSNVSLQKDDNYILQATFDLREWPEAKNKDENTDAIHWFMTIFSSDTVALVRDTTKEDREKAIKKSWEDKEPGRANNAKKARQKYILSQKEDLTPEEQALVNAPRVTKKQREEEAKQATQKKGPKKDDKKGGKQTKVEAVIEQPKERVFPKSQDHVNEAINSFLNHLEEERIQDKLAQHAGLINVRNDMQKREIVEEISMGKEEITGILQRNLKMREEIKLLQKDQKELLIMEYTNVRNQYKVELQDIYKERDQFKSDASAIIKKEQQIFDLCKQDKVGNPEDIEKLISDPSTVNPVLVSAAKQVIQNWKISIIQDKIANALQQFDVETLKLCLDQITNMNIEGIDTTAAEDMIDEAAGNPNFVQEKMAELKKQGKKPAKK